MAVNMEKLQSEFLDTTSFSQPIKETPQEKTATKHIG
jgi:hypothetical protein